MSAELKKTSRPTSPALSLGYSNKYGWVTSVEGEKSSSVQYSDLVKRESESYESVTDIFPREKLKESFQKGARSERMKRDFEFCYRCGEQIGNRPFCYKCFGPQFNTKNSKQSYLLPLISFGIIILAIICIVVCLMHIYRMGLYKEDNILVLEKKIEVAILQLKYFSALFDGFHAKLIFNMTLVHKNIAEMKAKIVNESNYVIP